MVTELIIPDTVTTINNYALLPIEVTLSGIVMLVRLEQPLNVPLPIEVTLSGIVMLVRLEQL